jgi:hypothetical protein
MSLSPAVKNFLNHTLPPLAVFGGVNLVGKLCHVNLMPIAISAAVILPALQVLAVLSRPQKLGRTAGVICINMGQSLIMTIQYLALRRCGFLDHRATIGLIAATVVTGLVRSALFLFNAPATPSAPQRV